jgi:hypothetical protein
VGLFSVGLFSVGLFSVGLFSVGLAALDPPYVEIAGVKSFDRLLEGFRLG